MENKHTEKPTVTVLMPAYNREEFIKEAIEAVLASTYTNYELIIVDDDSSDNTLLIANEYAEKDDRIRVFKNDHNLDQFPNRNRAASYGRGDIIFCADSDDTIEPDALEYIVQQFNFFPQVNYATLFLSGEITKPTVIQSSNAVRDHFLKKEFLLVGPAGTVVRREFFNRIGRFPVAYGPAGDLYYNIKAASNTDVLLLPYMYFNYRRHAGQEINKTYSYLYNNYRYIKDIVELPELPLTREEKKRVLLKGKRAFLLQALMNVKNTGEIKATLKAFKLAGFGWKDFISGVINRSI